MRQQCLTSWKLIPKEKPVLFDRYVPLGPTLSVLMLSGALTLMVAGRQLRTMNDRAALREYAAIEIGFEAGLRAKAAA